MEGMTIGKLYVAGIIKDDTVITVRTGLFKVAAKGEWYLDKMVEYSDRELESFTWQNNNELFADLKEVQE